MKHTILLIIIFLSIQLAYSQVVGSIAPDFTLSNTEGMEYQLSSQKGKVVAVFFFGYACPTCIAIAPSVQTSMADAYKSNENFIVIGIDAWDGNSSQVKNFKAASNLSFNTLQKGSSVAKKWGTTYDKIVVIDQDGKIAFKGIGGAANHITEAIKVIDNELQKISTSIKNLNAANDIKLSVFPNPVINSATINFSLKKAETLNYSIVDLTGKLVFKETIGNLPAGNNNVYLPINQLNSGMYFIKVNSEKAVYTERFIIK